jgi:integrase
MPAISLLDGLDPPISLRIFGTDEDEFTANTPPKSHRITNPVTDSGEEIGSLGDFGRKIAEQFADRSVTDEDRRRASTEMTIGLFYDQFLRADRQSRLDPKTVALDDEALAWLTRVGKPAQWPFHLDWSGPPIACVTASWLASLVIESKGNGVSAGTVAKYLRHIRGMLNAAAKLGVIDRPVAVAIPAADVEARPFTVDEAIHIYRRLAAEPVMQVAFVLAIGTGARYSDLFWMRWDQIDFERRQVAFTAEKTDKFQVVPLTDVPLMHLDRLSKSEPPFARLVDQAIAPELRGDSHVCRWLNKRWRQLTGFAAPPKLKRDWPAGAVPHPWHSARSTAAMWVETQAAGMAAKLLGHVVDGGGRVTQTHYLVPIVSSDLRSAAESVVWPDCFREFEAIATRPKQLCLFD